MSKERKEKERGMAGFYTNHRKWAVEIKPKTEKDRLCVRESRLDQKDSLFVNGITEEWINSCHLSILVQIPVFPEFCVMGKDRESGVHMDLF
jgi:hypothetical protein